jgi:hypothetical protein
VARQQSSLVLTQHDEHYCHVALIAQAGGKKKAKEPAFDIAALSEFCLKVRQQRLCKSTATMPAHYMYSRAMSLDRTHTTAVQQGHEPGQNSDIQQCQPAAAG